MRPGSDRQGARPDGRVLLLRPSGGEVPVPLGRQRRHAADVDGPHLPRPCRAARHRLHARRALARPTSSSGRTRPHGGGCQPLVPRRHDLRVGRRARPGPDIAAASRAPFLELAVPDLREREVFVCGPSPFMAAARIDPEAELRFDMARHHEESFDFAELCPACRRSDALAAERGARRRRLRRRDGQDLHGRVRQDQAHRSKCAGRVRAGGRPQGRASACPPPAPRACAAPASRSSCRARSR